VARREDFGREAEAFFEAMEEPLACLARDLRPIIRSAIPEARETVKWGVPVYQKEQLICAIRPEKNYVALQFYWAGVELPDTCGLLEGTGKKMRYVKIPSPEDIHERPFADWIRRAAR
jgi:hypothetical protein